MFPFNIWIWHQIKHKIVLDPKIANLTKTPSTEEELPVRGVRRRRTPAVQHRQPR